MPFFIFLYDVTFQSGQRTLWYLYFFFAHENIKKQPQKLLIFGLIFFFQLCQPAQIRPKTGPNPTQISIPVP